jgi:hypothetical protein
MADHDGITRLWSDDDLDEALRELHTPTRDGTQALASARARLMAAATGDPAPVTPVRTPVFPSSGAPADATANGARKFGRRRRLRFALVAGVAAVLVAIGMLVPSFVTERNRPVNSADAIGVLNHATVAALGAADEPVGPGQYRYIGTHAWWTYFSGYDIARDENLIEMWVPAAPDDPNQQWMLDRRPTGNRVWIKGSEQQARDDGTFVDAVDNGITLRATAPCGNFYTPGPCPRAGSWQDPTPAFLAGLPRDPAQLYQRLQADAPVNDRESAELFVYVADALRTGLVPADLRAALYEALTRIDGIELTDQPANLDGRVGAAIGIDDGQFRHDIIIDPATGVFIGEREVLTDDLEGAPEGTTMNYTAVQTAVVDAIGTVPTN